jgi:carboxymethylenebutenolidase
MKFVLVVAMLIPFAAFAQSMKPCCQVKSPTSIPAHTIEISDFSIRTMTMLGDDPLFITAHESPPPSDFSASTGTFITFKTDDGEGGRAFEVKSPKPSNKVVFMFHEWWGLNEYIQQEAERLQKELGDVTVLALDLYDVRTTASPEEAGKLMQAVKTERAINIIKGTLEYIGKEARVATIGWCFGGGWSHQASLVAGKQAVACVIYYGMPEMDIERLKSSNAPVLGIFARQDNWITPEKVREFEQAMKEADKLLTVKMYDAVHAFANPSNPKHDKKAAEDAHKNTIAFLKKYL